MFGFMQLGLDSWMMSFQNPLLEGGDLSTMISMGTGSASFDDNGKSIYRNRRQVKMACQIWDYKICQPLHDNSFLLLLVLQCYWVSHLSYWEVIVPQSYRLLPKRTFEWCTGVEVIGEVGETLWAHYFQKLATTIFWQNCPIIKIVVAWLPIMLVLIDDFINIFDPKIKCPGQL